MTWIVGGFQPAFAQLHSRSAAASPGSLGWSQSANSSGVMPLGTNSNWQSLNAVAGKIYRIGINDQPAPLEGVSAPDSLANRHGAPIEE